MDTKLTKENQRNIATPAYLHAQVRELADRDSLKMYQVVAKAIDLYRQSYPNGSDQDGAQ